MVVGWWVRLEFGRRGHERTWNPASWAPSGLMSFDSERAGGSRTAVRQTHGLSKDSACSITASCTPRRYSAALVECATARFKRRLNATPAVLTTQGFIRRTHRNGNAAMMKRA